MQSQDSAWLAKNETQLQVGILPSLFCIDSIRSSTLGRAAESGMMILDSNIGAILSTLHAIAMPFVLLKTLLYLR